MRCKFFEVVAAIRNATLQNQVGLRWKSEVQLAGGKDKACQGRYWKNQVVGTLYEMEQLRVSRHFVTFVATRVHKQNRARMFVAVQPPSLSALGGFFRGAENQV